MLSCTQFLEDYGAYLGEDSQSGLRRELEEHLAHCRTCQVIVDTSARTVRIVTEAGDYDFHESLPERLVRRIMQEVRTGPRE